MEKKLVDDMRVACCINILRKLKVGIDTDMKKIFDSIEEFILNSETPVFHDKTFNNNESFKIDGYFDIGNYCIAIKDASSPTKRMDIIINEDYKYANVFNTDRNRETCESYELQKDFSYEQTMQEEITYGFNETSESCINLLQAIYEKLEIVAVMFDKVPVKIGDIIPIYPVEYSVIDMANFRSLYFSNTKNVVINISCFVDPEKDSINISVQGDKAYLYPYSRGGRKVSYDEYAPSKKEADCLKKVVKVLIDNNIDVSELPTELTDQAQYS